MAVTFRVVVDDIEIIGDPDEPEEDLIDAPTSGLEATHTVNVSPCPQALGEIPVSNPSDQVVTITTTASTPALNVSPESLVVEPGTSADGFLVEFNCATKTSFSGSVTLTATTSTGASEVINVPVSMTIIP